MTDDTESGDLKTWLRLIIAYLITFAVYNIGGFGSSDILLGVLFVITYISLTKHMLRSKFSFSGKAAATMTPVSSEIASDGGTDHAATAASGEAQGKNIELRELRIRRAAIIVSVIWLILYVIYMGGRINRDLDNPLFSGFYILLTAMGLYTLLYYALKLILESFFNRDIPDDIVASNAQVTGQASGYKTTTDRADWKTWLIYTGVILLCMMPLFLLNFPGTMTVDSFDQLEQARGLAPYSDHHPWVHTMLIKALYTAGLGLTGSVYGGIAAYTIFQMVVLAMSVAYAIVSVTADIRDVGLQEESEAVLRHKRISELSVSAKARIAMSLGFVLFPYNLAYSITMWKDVLFAAAVLLLTVTIYRLYCNRQTDTVADTGSGGRSDEGTYAAIHGGYAGVRDISLCIISGLGMCTLRHNGLYAYVITMAVILIYDMIRGLRDAAGKKRRMTILFCTALTLIATAIIRGPVQRANNVETGDFAHNIPIPLQQIGRVVYDSCTLTDDEWKMLERINDTQFIREEYTPGGADPMMQWVVFGDEEYLLTHKSEYVALWLKLGLKYPEEYLRAYVDQTKGYYTTMAPEQTEYYGILPNDDGLEPKSVLGARIRIKINEICEKLHTMLPVYGIFYSMGACFMLLILGAAVVILQDGKTGSRLLAYLPVVTLTLTLLIATPLCADLRYAYPLMLCMPTLICITLRCY